MKQQTSQEGMFPFWYMTIFIYCSLTICKHGCEVWKMFWQRGITNGAIANVTQKLPQIPVIQDFSPLLFLQQINCYLLWDSFLGHLQRVISMFVFSFLTSQWWLMASTAAQRSTSTTGASRGLTWTKAGLQSCPSPWGLGTVCWCWRRWAGGCTANSRVSV